VLNAFYPLGELAADDLVALFARRRSTLDDAHLRDMAGAFRVGRILRARGHSTHRGGTG
jgi:hypothetical protein